MAVCFYSIATIMIVAPVNGPVELNLEHRPVVISHLHCDEVSRAVGIFPDRVPRHVGHRLNRLLLRGFNGRQFRSLIVRENFVAVLNVKIIARHELYPICKRKDEGGPKFGRPKLHYFAFCLNSAIRRSDCQSSTSAVHQLLCLDLGRLIVYAEQINASLDVAIRPSDINAILVHSVKPAR